jgi:CHAT domain-containing protein/tetratricopeptide (TPR) repeat protein
LNGRAAYDHTLALAHRTLRIKEAHLGTEHAELVTSLLNLGDVLTAAVEFDQAMAVTQRAVALCEEKTGPNSLDVAEALDHLGGALSGARRYDDALKALNRSLGLKEKALAGTDVAIARTLEDIGLVLQRKGVYERSGTLLRRAASIQEAANIDHPAYARTLNLIAQQLWFEGQLIESRNTSERAVAVAERTLRPDHPTIALSLRYLAATLADLGDIGRSLALKERALAIAERNFGPNHYVTAEYLHTLAHAELREGAYARARQRFRRVLDIFEARYGPWHEYVATTYFTLARTDASLGDYANARREQARAVTVHARVGGPNHPFVATALTELAVVYREQGSPTEAIPLLERALAIREKNLGPNHRDVARTLADMASTHMQMGRSARAQVLASRALGIWERLDAPDAPDYATVLALYAEIQGNLGDSAAAKDLYERALRIRAKVFGTSHPLYADAESGLGLALANLQESNAALSTAVHAEATGREHLGLMLRSLPERQALNYAAARPRGLNVILSLSGSTPDAIPFALDGLIRSRALVLDEIAARQSAGRAAGEQTAPLWVALTSAQQRLTNLLVRGPGPMSPVLYRTVVEATRRESELAEQALAEQSAAFRAERRRAQIGLDDVRAAIPPEGALVSFVRYERSVFRTPKAAAASGANDPRPVRTVPSYMVLVLRPSGSPMAIPLGTATAIDALVTEWRVGLMAPNVAPAETAVRPVRVTGAELRHLIWDPVAKHLQGASRVFIVPDGSLSLVPFAGLPIAQASYLLETGPVIHYLSAERDLVLSARVSTAKRGLLAIGGPAFDNRTLSSGTKAATASTPTRQQGAVRGPAQICGGLQAIRFQPLAGTLQEVKELSSLWNARATSGEKSDSAQVLVGRAASEAAFKQEAPHYRILHLATHGFFLSDDCSTPTTGTRGVGGLSAARPLRAHAVENPLLLSGLALAGANQRAAAASDEDDGILTAEEVASLDLEGVEWAVLSACDTAVGEIKAGEGVFGLRRAFQVAGARTVIMSLWSVEDRSAMEWMRALYEARLRRGLNTADAVHEASLTVLRQRRARGQSVHPFFWAGFVAAGDWR